MSVRRRHDDEVGHGFEESAEVGLASAQCDRRLFTIAEVEETLRRLLPLAKLDALDSSRLVAKATSQGPVGKPKSRTATAGNKRFRIGAMNMLGNPITKRRAVGNARLDRIERSCFRCPQKRGVRPIRQRRILDFFNRAESNSLGIIMLQVPSVGFRN